MVEIAPQQIQLDLGAPRWWFSCLYTGGMHTADQVIVGVLPPLLADARRAGATRWFYIRYFDDRGAHIRLRVFGPTACLNRLVRLADEMGQHIETIVARSSGANVELVEGAYAALSSASDAQIGIYPAVYEPETLKYGGIEAMEFAEQLFEFSSELALWGVQHYDKGEQRDSLATLLLADTAGALLLGNGTNSWTQRKALGWNRFWSTHTRWWSGADYDGGRLRTQLRQRAALDREEMFERMRDTADNPEVEVWRRRWVGAVEEYLTSVEVLNLNRTPQHLAFHHNHMLMNRLGYMPREEALLGLHARAWISEVIYGEPRNSLTTSAKK